MSALEKLEELAEAVHGKGACVSVDHGRDSGERGMIVRVWSTRGFELAHAKASTAEAACKILLRRGAK